MGSLWYGTEHAIVLVPQKGAHHQVHASGGTITAEDGLWADWEAISVLNTLQATACLAHMKHQVMHVFQGIEAHSTSTDSMNKQAQACETRMSSTERTRCGETVSTAGTGIHLGDVLSADGCASALAVGSCGPNLLQVQLGALKHILGEDLAGLRVVQQLQREQLSLCQKRTHTHTHTHMDKRQPAHRWVVAHGQHLSQEGQRLLAQLLGVAYVAGHLCTHPDERHTHHL